MSRDLAEVHELTTDLFRLPASQEAADLYRLSQQQVEFFAENGYVAGIRALDDNQVDKLRDELAGFFQPDHEGRELWYEYHNNESTDPDTVLFHALGAWRLGAAFHDLIWNPAITVPAAQLLAGPVRFWHDQLFCKPAHHGGVVAWHQDYSYWQRTQPMAHLTCWIGLDDSDRDNGCLHYVPKSHKWDLLPVTGLAGDMESIREVLSDEQWAAFQHPAVIELKQGECAFHHPLLVHGSFENRTSRPRRATVVNMFADGVCSASNEVLLQGVPAVAAGERMQGKFFPITSPSLD